MFNSNASITNQLAGFLLGGLTNFQQASGQYLELIINVYIRQLPMKSKSERVAAHYPMEIIGERVVIAPEL